MKQTSHFLFILFCIGLFITSCTKEEHFHTDEITNNYNGIPEAKGVEVTNNPTEILAFEDLFANYSKGDKLKLRINRTGLKVEEFEVTFEATYDYDGERLVFCKTPINLAVGFGDSGSPVLTMDGKLVAILCYGYWFNNNQFAARAIEDVKRVGSGTAEAKSGQMNSSMGFRSLSPVYMVAGMSDKHFEKYTQRDKKGYFSKYQQFSDFQRSSSTKRKGVSNNADIIPGSSICVQEVTGDVINFVATGTASYIDGNKVFGFGHPYREQQPVAMPAFVADMKTMIESGDAAFKLSVPTDVSIGAMTADEFEGILIEKDVTPSKFDITTNIKVGTDIVENNMHSVAHFTNKEQEEYHAINLPPFLAFYHSYKEQYDYARAVGTVTIVYESGTFTHSFDVEDSGYWIDWTIADDIRFALEEQNFTGHVQSVNFQAAITQTDEPDYSEEY